MGMDDANHTPPDASADRALARAERLAGWLDDRYLDPLLGFLIPGAGDLAGLAGIYIPLVALRMGLPRVVIARMLLNLAVDTAVGSIPVVGDLFDAFFKSNRRNMRLLRRRHEGRARDTSRDWLWLSGALALLLLAFALPVALLVLALSALF